MDPERLIELELSRLNAHLPRAHISLAEALRAERPGVETRSGTFHSFRREELRDLSGLLSEKSWGELRLPILIWMTRSLGSGAAVVRGDLEVKVICSVLGKRAEGSEIVIYGPEISAVRSRFPTTTQYAFSR
ncbi:MAG: DUF61 family protein [Candidatus Hadarchaeales archaeon]